MRTGLERLLDEPKRWLGRARVGLVANPTTVDRHLTHGADLMHRHPDIDLRLLFGPEHGIRGAAQDMVGVGDARDPVTGLPEVSLYGKTFESLSPTPAHLSQIDVLVFDIQDIGARYYTYAATMALCMRAAKSAGVKVVVLDRPEPDRRSANRRRWSRPGTRELLRPVSRSAAARADHRRAGAPVQRHLRHRVRAGGRRLRRLAPRTVLR